MVIYYYNFVEIIKLFILNDRVNGDEEGVFTCNQSSVVYYCIYIYTYIIIIVLYCTCLYFIFLNYVLMFVHWNLTMQSKTSTYDEHERRKRV